MLWVKSFFELKYNSSIVHPSLQFYSWIYSEIIVLKKKMGELQNELDEEKLKRIQLENQVGNIPKKLKAMKWNYTN